MRTSFSMIFFVTFGLFTFACGGGTSSKAPPSCAQLQTQIDACTMVSDAGKKDLAPFCANASDDCRTCLDGQLCGVTEQCDAVCGKGDAGAGADGGKEAPSCAQLQKQIETCTTVSDAGKQTLGVFCAGVTKECRACLDGQLCAETEHCDSLCGKGDAGHPSDSARLTPSCAQLQAQIDACANISDAGKGTLGAFCASATVECRACRRRPELC